MTQKSNYPKVSVYILAYNEEAKIEDCIKSVLWADEVVVIDSHSTDKTAQIAEVLGAKVVQVDFTGFGKIRASGIEHTIHDWILSIDADERCTPDAKNEILRILGSYPSADAYFIPRRNIFMGKTIKFCGWYPDYRQPQLFKRGKLSYDADHQVHEGYSVIGKVDYLKNPIIQVPFLSYSELIQKMDRYTKLGADKLLAKNSQVSSLNIAFRSCWAFIQTYIIKLGFLDGWAGFVIAFCNMEGTFFKYTKYKELLRQNSNDLND
jgi:glycosyltransferase involved in cell wall biosynthesis